MDERYIDLTTAYLNDSLTSAEEGRLNQLLEEGQIDPLELKEMEALYEGVGNLPVPDPSEALAASFYRRLEEEKTHQSERQHRPFLQSYKVLLLPHYLKRYALVAAVFMLGVLAGNLFTPFRDYNRQLDKLSTEVAQVREVMMLNLLEAPSSADRLQAVNISSDITEPDERVVTALLKTLNHDPNVNVRLASIEALLHHADQPAVREGLVASISRQQSPHIQVALADAMLALQETNSIEDLRRLLEQPELDHTVQEKITSTIAALKS